jgi:hypothetical protein
MVPSRFNCVEISTSFTESPYISNEEHYAIGKNRTVGLIEED